MADHTKRSTGDCLCRDLRHAHDGVLSCPNRTDRLTCDPCHANHNTNEAPRADPVCWNRIRHHLNQFCNSCNGWG